MKVSMKLCASHTFDFFFTLTPSLLIIDIILSIHYTLHYIL